MNELKIRFVVATRERRGDFLTKTATGRSLALYSYPFVEVDIYPENTYGLPTCYNRSIEKSKNDPAVLVFCHDDLLFLDFYWPQHIDNALKTFDIFGIVGNKRRVPNQFSWAFTREEGDNFLFDARENLSGILGHGQAFPPENLSVFGMPGQEVKLLDGLLLACRSNLLWEYGLRFDERFKFHFYDLDFCREAELRGLRMGTWGLSLVHESKGDFTSKSWAQARETYFKKWGA